MKKYLYSTLLMLLCTVTGAFAQSMTISGGNDHSLFICTKGVLYACGDNSDGRLGLTAPNAGTQYVPTFSQVDVTGLSFEQVTAGSGAHNVALACNGLVYCWGANAELQCGVAGGGSVSSPTPVLCGEADGYDENGNKGGIYLGGVTFIAASTSASFALLEDGTVVGWGGNSAYGGGKWIDTPTSTPQFIRTPDGKVLQGVTFIAGGDNNLLLKVDPDGDGLGDAYSVGTYNGRGGGLGAQEYYAEPVLLYKDETQDGMKQGPGDPLTNIRMLAAGDAAGFAVDGITGYVYAWGENGGNGRCGLPYAADYLYAAKMVSGDYQRISNESYLTNVKEVVGGNGWGAAITNEGYMLYWGKNNDPTFATWGGTVPDPDFAGQGTNAADATIVYNGVIQPHKNGPVFAKYEDNSIVDNAVHLGRGDLFGFMSNSEDKYFVWGQTQSTATGNPHTGHMATGKVNDFKNYLHEIQTPCAPADPCPEAYMVGPKYKCPGETISLYSGFTPSKGKESSYEFIWYKDGVELDRLLYDSEEIDVDAQGEYKVGILYVGSNTMCKACDTSFATVKVIDMDMPIDTIITNLNCVANPMAPSAGDKISFEAVVNDKFYKATDNVTFAAFSTPTSTDTIRIVKTTGAGGQILLPKISGDSVLQVNDNAATTGDTTYSIWLEDITSFETYLLKDEPLSVGGNVQSQGLMIEIFSPAHLQSFDVAAMTYNGAGQFSVTPQVYEVTLNTNSIPVVGNLYWQGDEQDFNITATPSTHTVICDVVLPANPMRGTRYVLGLKMSGNGFQPMKLALTQELANNSPIFVTPMDDSGGFGIQAIGSTINNYNSQSNPGKEQLMTNIKFGKLTDYDCGRIELQARLGCPPCNQLDPTTVKITVSDPTVTDTIFLCQESPAVTLSVSGVKGAPSAEAGAKFDILWYENSLATNAVKTDLAETSSTYPASITWNASKAGTSEKVFLQARDNKEPNGECHEEDSIVIVYNEIPVAPAIADMQFCVNAATADKPNLNDTLQTAKFSDFDVTWTNPTAIPDLQGADGATAGTKTYEYTVTSKSTGCVSAAATFDVTVLDKPVAPAVKNLDFVVTPNTPEKVEQGATATTGHTLTWYDNTSKSVYPAPGSSASPTVTLDAEKQESFWVAQISDIGGCISDTVRIDVTVNDAPVPDAVNDTVCLGISVDVTKLVTVGDQRNPNDRYVPVWYNDFGANKEDSVSASAVMMDPNNPGEQLFYVAQKNLATGAISNKKTFAVYVYGVYKPTVDNSVINYCAKDPATVLTANQMKNENDGYMADDFVWTLDGRGVNSPLPDTDVTNDTSYTYRVHQIYTIPTDQNQVCVGDSVEVTVNVTHVPQLTVGSVLYLKSDANASGSFDNNLMQQNTGLITGNMEQGATLNWYESDCATPVPGTPTPTVDSSIPTGVDQNVTYCVSQTVNGCEGEKIKVDVKISDAMPPTVEHLIYCEGSVIEDLTAKVSTLPGENESDFELLWYRNQPADVNAAYDYYGEATDKFAMNSQIASVTNSAVTVTSYWVAQRNKSTQAVSTATELKVIVYPKPVVITTAPDAICGNDGNVLELNANPAIWSVANEADLKANSIATITPQFFDGQGNSLGASSAVNASGTYSIGATYNVTSTLGGVNIKDNTCTGDPVQVAVQVHYLSDLSITGVNSTCPSTKVTLTASATSTDPGVISYVWGGDGAGATGDTYTTPTLTERINNQGTQIPYSYTVQATAGKCVLDVATPHEVVIGDGPVIGNMTIAETGNSEAPITFTGDVPREFYSCGGEVMLTVDFTKTAGDYTWFDETGNQVGTGATYTVPATQFTVDRKYRLEYTNQCPTFTEVTIKAVPLTAKALQKGDIVLCEGEPFMVSMEYACLENPSIQWYRDGSMIGSIEKEMKIEKTIVSDGGLYSFVAKNRGCTVSDTAYNLVVKPYIQVTDIADPLVIARGGNQSITLPITVPANGLVQSISWKENGAEVYNGNPYTLTDVRADHYYDIFLDDPNHCSDTTEITVWVDAELQLSTTLKDTICLGATETLVIDTTGTGAFRQFNVTPSLIVTEESDGNIMDITDKIQKVGNLLNIPVAPKVNTTYKVEFSYGNQFVSSTEFAVVIPAIEVTTPAIPTICEGEQVKLQVTDIKPIGTSVSWVSDPTIIDGQNSEILTVQPVYTGGVNHQSVYVYTLMATNSICGTSKPYEVKVKVDEPITGNITGVNAICEGQSTVLDASSFQAGTYSWSTNGSAVGVMDVINVSPAATATYELSMTRGLCSASASYTVLVSTNPVIMRIDSVALRDREIILDPSYGTAPFTYAIDSREPDVNSIKENLSFTSHIAKVVDAAGCQTSVQFSMQPPAITIPEHFSPNGDGINDTWVCPSLADVYPNSLVSIYDRYGKLLVQFLGADAEGWDGTYMGVDMPSTDYWYQIDIEEINRQYVGHFTLIRR